MSQLHPLEHLITSRGLRRACLYYDLFSAVNRWQLTHNGDEIAALLPEQLIMLLVQTNQVPGSDLWTFAETLLGPLTPPLESDGHPQ